MYSVVLLAALTAGENTPNFGKKYHGSFTYGACYGACYGVCYGGYDGYHWNGGWGLPYGGYGPAGGYGPPGYACFAACGCYSSPAYGFPYPVIGGPAETPKRDEPSRKDDDQASAANRARLIVELPAGAKLFVDDAPISDAAPKKSFRTPELQKGQEYYYEVRAELIRDGKPVSESRKIVVKAGEVIRTDFRSLGVATGVAAVKSR
jgi:uncharacterized protein (TIGR03000 family)